jgi:hypothetical protein
VSTKANREDIDLRSVGNASIDSRLRGGAALVALTDAAIRRDEDELPAARDAAIDALGAPSTMRALAVAGNFEMMNRLLDAIGVGPAPQMRDTGEAIGVPLPARWQ